MYIIYFVAGAAVVGGRDAVPGAAGGGRAGPHLRLPAGGRLPVSQQ